MALIFQTFVLAKTNKSLSHFGKKSHNLRPTFKNNEKIKSAKDFELFS